MNTSVHTIPLGSGRNFTEIWRHTNSRLLVSPMNDISFLVEELAEGGFTAKAVGIAIFTEAETFEELKANAIDAVRCHFDEDELPKVIRLRYLTEEIITV